jgi:hypothetical protein
MVRTEEPGGRSTTMLSVMVSTGSGDSTRARSSSPTTSLSTSAVMVRMNVSVSLAPALVCTTRVTVDSYVTGCRWVKTAAMAAAASAKARTGSVKRRRSAHVTRFCGRRDRVTGVLAVVLSGRSSEMVAVRPPAMGGTWTG